MELSSCSVKLFHDGLFVSKGYLNELRSKIRALIRLQSYTNCVVFLGIESLNLNLTLAE